MSFFNQFLGFCSRKKKQTKTKALVKRVAKAKKELVNIMSKITDWAAAEEVELAGITSVLNGIIGGIVALDNAIIALQKTPGQLNQEDQDALDRISAASAALRSKAEHIDISIPTPVAPAPAEPLTSDSGPADPNASAVEVVTPPTP